MTADPGDELDIRAGGLVAVDTETLRHVAGLLAAVSTECADLAARLRAAGVASARAGLWDPSPAGRAEEAEERAAELARALRECADLYEEVERSAARQGTGGDGLSPQAQRLWEAWQGERHAEVERQLIGAVGPVWQAALLLGSFTAAIRSVDRGAILRADPALQGALPPVRLTEVSRAAARPPTSLAEVAARIPGDGESRVRVEVYGAAGGAREYVVYIAGTQDLGRPYAEPWDMASNLELYFGHASASYAATMRAIEAAGAGEGDRVHLVGHSQGGMIATHLARQGGYDVGSLITFASPVQAQLDDDILNVTVRHADDPIAALSAGGVPVVAGSAESFVVERVADPGPRLADFALGVHDMDVYRQTAAMVDASDDPRVTALRVQWEGLAAAGVGTAIVYGARREHGPVRTSSGGGGGRVSASSSAGAG